MEDVVKGFEVRIDFDRRAGSPERVFVAMAQYVKGFDGLLRVVSNGIDPHAKIDFSLAGIEAASLKGCIGCFSRFADILAKIPSAIARQLVDQGDISEAAQVDQIIAGLKGDIEPMLEGSFIDSIAIDSQLFARELKKMLDAAVHLSSNDRVEISSSGVNVVALNTGARFTGNPDLMFIGSELTCRHMDILQVRRPTFIGKAMWELRSLKARRSFQAHINDEGWLADYQDGSVRLEPGDSLAAEIVYKAFRHKNSTEFEYRDHQIIKVHRVVRKTKIQQELELLCK